MKKKSEKIKDTKFHIAEMLEVPKDVALGESIITLTGKREVLIENYRGIIEYHDRFIKIKTKNGIIEMVGVNFLITYLTDEEVKITGNIQNIKY